MTWNPNTYSRKRSQSDWTDMLVRERDKWAQFERQPWREDRLSRFSVLTGCPQLITDIQSPAGAHLQIGFPVEDPRTFEKAWVGLGELVKYCLADLPPAARLLASCQ